VGLSIDCSARKFKRPFYGAPADQCIVTFWLAKAVGGGPVHRAAAHSTGEGRLDNLVIIVVFLIAVAQALTILLTLRRERDIKELGELVDAQRLHIVELKAWLAGRNAAQPHRTEREPIGEPISEPIANNPKASGAATTPKDSAETLQSRTTEDEAAQAMKVLNWQREIIAGLRAGLKWGAPPEPAITRVPEPAITPKDLPDAIRPSTAENELKPATKAFKWFKEDADEPREIVAAREIVALSGGVPPEPAMTPKDLSDAIRPSAIENELERANKAIDWLKENTDKAKAQSK
jgi:hypothetical protein